jgi:hypothetical protein
MKKYNKVLEYILDGIAYFIVLALIIVVTIKLSERIGVSMFDIINNKTLMHKLHTFYCEFSFMIMWMGGFVLSWWAVKRVSRMF